MPLRFYAYAKSKMTSCFSGLIWQGAESYNALMSCLLILSVAPIPEARTII